MPTRTGKTHWGANQRNHAAVLFRQFVEDESQGCSYHANELTTDYLDGLYNAHPVFQATEQRYFAGHLRQMAVKFNTDLELQGGRRQSEFFLSF